MLNKLRTLERAKECTQNALETVWAKQTQCREPQSFLRWAHVIALNQCSDLLQQELSAAVPESDMVIADEDYEQNPLADEPAVSEPSSRLDDDAVRARLESAIRQCLLHSERQQRVIIEIFLNERSVKETADLLRLTPGNVSVLRNRALKALRSCANLVSALEDWLDSRP